MRPMHVFCRMAQKTPIVLSNGKTPTDNHGSTKAAWVRQFFEQLHGQKDKHVRCMVMKPFHATRGLVQVGTVANEPLMLSRCDKEYNNTSTDIWIKHVHEKHDIAIPARFEECRGCIEPHQQVLNFARVHGEYDSYSGAKRTRDSQQVRTDAIVLAHCMNPMIPFECTDNPYFRLAYADAAWKDSSIKSAQSLKDAIMDFYARLQAELKKTVRGICGFQMDAGKDCKSRKLER